MEEPRNGPTDDGHTAQLAGVIHHADREFVAGRCLVMSVELQHMSARNAEGQGDDG